MFRVFCFTWTPSESDLDHRMSTLNVGLRCVWGRSLRWLYCSAPDSHTGWNCGWETTVKHRSPKCISAASGRLAKTPALYKFRYLIRFSVRLECKEGGQVEKAWCYYLLVSCDKMKIQNCVRGTCVDNIVFCRRSSTYLNSFWLIKFWFLATLISIWPVLACSVLFICKCVSFEVLKM